MTSRKINEANEVDEYNVEDLALYIENDGRMYEKIVKPTILNLAKKVAKGNFEKEKALISFKRIADEGAKKYKKELGSGNFSVAERKAVAEELLDYYMDYIEELAGTKNESKINENKEVTFKDNPEDADRYTKRDNLSVEEFVKRNIYNTWTLDYCFAKHSPLSKEQKQVLKNYLLNFKNGQIEGYDKNLEKWVKNMGLANIKIDEAVEDEELIFSDEGLKDLNYINKEDDGFVLKSVIPGGRRMDAAISSENVENFKDYLKEELTTIDGLIGCLEVQVNEYDSNNGTIEAMVSVSPELVLDVLNYANYRDEDDGRVVDGWAVENIFPMYLQIYLEKQGYKFRDYIEKAVNKTLEEISKNESMVDKYGNVISDEEWEEKEAKGLNEAIENDSEGALADFLGIEPSEVTQASYDHLGIPVFEADGEEWAITTDYDLVEEAAKEEVIQLIDELGVDALNWDNMGGLENYLDKEWFEDWLKEDCEAIAYDYASESNERLAEEMTSIGMNPEDYGWDGEDFQTDPRDDFGEKLYNYKMEGWNNDAIDYFVSNLGQESLNAVIADGTVQLDAEKAAEEVLATDGAGHLLSGYDGKEVDHDFDGITYYMFRIN